MPKNTPRPVTAIGDAHGDYHALAAVLIHAGLMDAELNWAGGKTILVQIGDILDRGSAPLQIDELFDVLQPKARKAGGEIVRLVGNHELEILRKNYFITSLPYFQIEPFRRKLIDAIAAGSWRAAYSARGFLFTHAGVCDSLYSVLKQEAGTDGKKMTESKTAEHINKVFKEAAASGDYKHPIFNVSYVRGGSERFGGIFWEDLSSLFANHALCPFRQIVGHTVVKEITVSPEARIIAVDVGMGKVFNGGFEYLKIGGKKSARVVKITGDDAQPQEFSITL
jgi:hypothetical protein